VGAEDERKACTVASRAKQVEGTIENAWLVGAYDE
jgi:hypothetical protein